MGTKGKTETERSDLGSLLETLIGRVRRDGLAAMGFAASNYPRKDPDHRTLEALAESLGHTANLLDSVHARLCQDCQMVGVTERWAFSASPAPGKRRAGKGSL